MSFLRYVNCLQGTDSSGQLSTGSTEPIVALPFGMAHWMLQTNDFWGWQFHPKATNLQGIRLTHQPSPWMGDYGAILISPQTGEKVLRLPDRKIPWKVADADIKPDGMKIGLPSIGTDVELAPTERCSILRFRFQGSTNRLLIQGVKGESQLDHQSDRLVTGWTKGNSGGVPANWKTYIAIRLDKAPTSFSPYSASEANDKGENRAGDRFGICLEFGNAREVVVRVGTSFISPEQALLNLDREVGSHSLEQVRSNATRAWEKTLGQIEIGDEDERLLRTFYSCFYRTKLFPRQWHEYDAQGKQIHFSPYDGKVHDGPLYADTGFWDTYRTQHPLMTILEPKRQSEIIQGFISAYHDSGWMPQWPSPGHRVSMPGTHLDATIADAIAKGITDFDQEAALAGMLQHADHPNHGGPFGAGRNDIQDYLDLGYSVGGGAVAQTLDYAYDDWAIAQLARKLNHREVEERMMKRSQNWKNLYDSSVGFMRPKEKDGSWGLNPFDPLYWGGPYVEGGPWQSSWAVPHDPSGLMVAMGGEKAFAAKLDEMLSTTSDFHVGGYGGVIHEMTEMKIQPFGQYAHSNQPVHHVLYLYLVAGRPWRAQKELRRVMSMLYSPDGFAGDEDNGEMAAWYVLSALGLYALCPGRPEWAIGSPAVKKAKIHLPNGRTLTIDAPENASNFVYVDSASFNGHVLKRNYLKHSEIVAGGSLHFHMSDHSWEQVVPPSWRPSSETPYPSS